MFYGTIRTITCCGKNNIFFGAYAGCTTADGSCNIAIGPSVLLSSATANNELAIGAGSCRWLRGDSSYNLCLGNSTAIKAMASGTLCATCFVGDGTFGPVHKITFMVDLMLASVLIQIPNITLQLDMNLDVL